MHCDNKYQNASMPSKAASKQVIGVNMITNSSLVAVSTGVCVCGGRWEGQMGNGGGAPLPLCVWGRMGYVRGEGRGE